MSGFRVTRTDMARINRAVIAHEAGTGPRPNGQQLPRGPVLTAWMLNGKFQPPDDDTSPFNPEVAYGRRLAAQAVLMEPTSQRVQMLRPRSLDATAVDFRIQFDGEQTELLADDISAEELQAALQELPGLAGLVNVIGLDSELVEATDDADAISYAARQWHLVYSEDLAAELLPELVPGSHNLRIFRDWFLPSGVVDQVWSGLPHEATLEPGAFGFCYPFPVYGWTWIHGECWSKEA